VFQGGSISTSLEKGNAHCGKSSSRRSSSSAGALFGKRRRLLKKREGLPQKRHLHEILLRRLPKWAVTKKREPGLEEGKDQVLANRCSAPA